MAFFPAVSDGGDLSQVRIERRLRFLLMTSVRKGTERQPPPTVRFLTECDSTNRVAMEWARGGAPERCLVVADYQTGGRGRLDRRWFSPSGQSLLFSLILRPTLAPERLGLISLAAGVALAATIAGEGLQARLKWPNDVLVAGRKVAGILAETELGGSSRGAARAPVVVLGVGVNVNIDWEAFALAEDDLARTATSLSVEAGRRFDRLELLAGFLARFHRSYVDLAAERPSVLDAYRSLCDTLGRRVRIEGMERVFEARALDVDASGGLVLDTGEVVRAGDVVHLRAADG